MERVAHDQRTRPYRRGGRGPATHAGLAASLEGMNAGSRIHARHEMLVRDHRFLDGPKGELLRLLEKLRDRAGLTEAVIRALVDQSDVTYPGVHLPLVTSVQRTDHVRFMMQGVAKVVCDVPGFGRVIVDLVGKGEFLCLPPATAPDPLHRVEAVVHEGPVVMALIPGKLLATAIGQLPPSNAARLVSWSWRAASRLAHAKAALLGLPTGGRLIGELARLARRFGRPEDDGWTVIQVRLSQEDLASLIVRSRSNVSRAFTKLREDGLVDRVGRRILIATFLLHPGGPPGSGGPHAGNGTSAALP